MRRQTQPPLDLVPVMGLASLLIPLLLLGQGFPLAAIDVNLPAMCGCHGEDHGHPDLVPTVLLTSDGITLQVDADATELAADQLPRLSELLGDLRSSHEASGKLILVAESSVEYERLIDAMDASREHFPTVTIAGGVL